MAQRGINPALFPISDSENEDEDQMVEREPDDGEDIPPSQIVDDFYPSGNSPPASQRPRQIELGMFITFRFYAKSSFLCDSTFSAYYFGSTRVCSHS